VRTTLHLCSLLALTCWPDAAAAALELLLTLPAAAAAALSGSACWPAAAAEGCSAGVAAGTAVPDAPLWKQNTFRKAATHMDMLHQQPSGSIVAVKQENTCAGLPIAW
jgi:hypothetical protein